MAPLCDPPPGFTRANLVLLTSTLVLLAVEFPLFLAGDTVTLGFTHAAGPFVHAFAGLGAWRVYRHAAGTHRCAIGTDRCDARVSAPNPIAYPTP